MSKPCDYDNNLANYTMCPHVLQVPLGSVVQLVIAITVSNPGKQTFLYIAILGET